MSSSRFRALPVALVLVSSTNRANDGLHCCQVALCVLGGCVRGDGVAIGGFVVVNEVNRLGGVVDRALSCEMP